MTGSCGSRAPNLLTCCVCVFRLRLQLMSEDLASACMQCSHLCLLTTNFYEELSQLWVCVVPSCSPLCSSAVSRSCHAMPWAAENAHAAAWVSLGAGSESGCGLLSHIGTAPTQPALSLALGWGMHMPLCDPSFRAGCAVRDAHMRMRMRACQEHVKAVE